MKTKSIVLIGVLITLLVSMSLATQVVINSQRWQDVYAGIYWAQLNGMNAFFLNSPNPQGLFNILPKDKNVILIESKDEPMVPNLRTLLENSGYNVDYKSITDGSVDLMPKQINKFVVVEDDFPYAAVVAAPLAKVNNAWVLLVNNNNANKVTSILSNAKYVIGVGYFKRDIYSRIKPYISKEITGNGKFDLSVKVAEEFLKIKPTTQAVVTDGSYLENELLLGANPVLLVGKNLLPDVVMDFMKTNNIKTVVIMGSQLTYVGERIRTLSNKSISVFIKFGEATPGVSQTIYALTMFPLVSKEPTIKVVKVSYDPSQKRLYVIFKNEGSVGIFELTSLRLVANGEDIASLGDKVPVFIGAGETTAITFNVTVPAEYLDKNLTVQLYTSYGDSADNLDKYITAAGKFGPPLAMPVNIEKIQDNSRVELEGITYYTGYRRFGIKLKNTGDVNAWVSVKLIDVVVNGIQTSLSSERIRMIKPGEEKTIYIPAQLDELDIQDNDMVHVIVTYGQRKDLLINTVDKEVELEIDRSMPVEQILLIVGVVILLVIVVAFFVFRKKGTGYSRSTRRSRRRL